MNFVSKSLKKAFFTAAIGLPLTFGAAAFADDDAIKIGGSQNLVNTSQPASQGFNIGPLNIGSPLLFMSGAGALLLLWYLMRSIPPTPRKQEFPGMMILRQLVSEEQEPAKAPLWQKILRLTAAGAVIGGLSQLEFNPQSPIGGEGPVILVDDNGWISGQNWEARAEERDDIFKAIEREGRSVYLLPTAPEEDGSPVRLIGPLDAEKARSYLDELEPQPWPVDRSGSLEALSELDTGGEASIIWLYNGLGDEGSLALAERLLSLGTVRMVENPPSEIPLLISPVDENDMEANDGLKVKVQRLFGEGDATLQLTASDKTGNALATAEVAFRNGEAEKTAVFDLPKGFRKQVARVSINGEKGAGTVLLIDENWRRRPVGLVDAGDTHIQPLLQESHYIRNALNPYVDLKQGSPENLLENPLSVMILPDAEGLSINARKEIEGWVNQGGTLLRFAGPRLAADTKDNLLPVELRPGERNIFGELTGSKRGKLAPFEEGSPFHGLQLPEDVRIEREVLAQPDFDLHERTWAQLEDGTPVVTAKRVGKGWIVLIHTTASPDWSNLSLSGLFADMMRAVISHSQGVICDPDSSADIKLPPVTTLNGKGKLTPPPPAASPLNREAVRNGDVSPRHPPGFYGHDTAIQAHNLSAAIKKFEKPAGNRFPEIERDEFVDKEEQRDLRGPLLAAGLSLLLLDLLIISRPGTLPAVLRRRREDEHPAAPEP
jgi:hypothetical protein